MMKNEGAAMHDTQDKQQILDMRENLTAIHVAAQLMCRQSEGRQTYPVAKSIVMLTEQALETLKGVEPKVKGKA